ncbi:hypothetical protein MAMMFC1_03202 [Methylomusa anaerophila]|uniref:Uncharacterized protein n=1 Tax=Methylomusa anaerophila TaxID=1930071 RepID=A0A348AN61_9FIRM|nr:hypothetical protein MAMMFC1_03202 [Methylomusa anaerophila]
MIRGICNRWADVFFRFQGKEPLRQDIPLLDGFLPAGTIGAVVDANGVPVFF